MRGIYVLLISLGGEASVRVGGLGRIDFKAGTYAYVGSGLGSSSSSAEGRLRRHFSKRKRMHWHIDYLLGDRRFKLLAAILSEAGRPVECDLARGILGDSRARVVHRGFGASDCLCDGHLVFFEGLNGSEAERLVWERFKGLGLKPERWKQ